jgi:hypothetical protein
MRQKKGTRMGNEAYRKNKRGKKLKIGRIDVQFECAVEMVLNLFLSSISVVSYVSVSISPLSSFALASLVF